jgi:hypothetical protein
MPRGDRTGPMGMGPMTGRGVGYCSGFGRPGFVNPIPGQGTGLGFRRGRGGRGAGLGAGGRGWRHWFYATGLPGWLRFGGQPTVQPKSNSDAEKQTLKAQADFLKSELDRIKTRLSEMEAPSAGK